MKKILIFLTAIFISVASGDFFISDKVKEIYKDEKVIKIGNYKYSIFKGCKGWEVGDKIVFKKGMGANRHCLQTEAINLSKDNSSCILMCDI